MRSVSSRGRWRPAAASCSRVAARRARGSGLGLRGLHRRRVQGRVGELQLERDLRLLGRALVLLRGLGGQGPLRLERRALEGGEPLGGLVDDAHCNELLGV